MLDTLSVTQLFSLFFGLYFLSAGLGMLLDREAIPTMFGEIIRNPAIGFSLGLIAFSIGAVVVSVHAKYDGVLDSIISIFGWIALLEGILMLAFRKWFLGIFQSAANSRTLISGAALFAILMGATFIWSGLQGL